MAKDQTGAKSAPKKGPTPEQIKARETRKAERNEAKKRVLAFLNANKEELGDELIKDILLFVGRPKAPRAAKASVNSALRVALLEAGEKGLSEMDIFKMFKIGRPEMTTKIRILVLTPNPDDRVWVRFDEESETYFVVGQGANPPKGWDGYLPANKESL